MKILYLSKRLLSGDGSAIHGTAFINSVRTLGHEIHPYPNPELFSTSGSHSHRSLWRRISTKLQQSSRALNIILSTLEGFFDGVVSSRKILRICKEFEPDIIIYRPIIFNFTHILLRRMVDTPMVAEVNSLRLVESKIHTTSPFLRWWTEKVEYKEIMLSQGCFCVSNELHRMIKNMGYHAATAVVPNGVDTDKFSRDKSVRFKIRSDLAIDASETIIGYVGSYKAWHNLPVAVETLNLLIARGQPVRLLLIGNGTERQSIVKLAASLQISEYIIFVDSIPHDQIVGHMSAIDIALMTYKNDDTFYFSPLKMFEYMAMGIPIVSTGNGQITEVLSDSYAGSLVDNVTAEHFATAVQELITNSNEYNRKSVISRELAINKYSWVENARKITALCQKVLSTRSSQTF